MSPRPTHPVFFNATTLQEDMMCSCVFGDEVMVIVVNRYVGMGFQSNAKQCCRRLHVPLDKGSIRD